MTDNPKKMIKFFGWTTVLSGVAYVYLCTKNNEPNMIDGFAIDIDANKIVDSGLSEFRMLSPEQRERLGDRAKVLLGKIIKGEVIDE